MKKIIIAPDSFKETMSNIEVSNIIYKTLKEKYPLYEYKLLPIADGGEGSLETILSCGGVINEVVSTTANFEKDVVEYLIYNDSLVIEVAQNVGFKYKKEFSNPGNTTTYGIGEVIKAGLEKGYKKAYVCLGGTITNDGGCGLASAMGIKFYDKEDKEFIPTGDTLINIAHIDKTNFIEKYSDIEVIGLCDVTNPLHGKMGASYIFAKQKGASDSQIESLDKGLRHLEEIVKKDLGVDEANTEGSGAAGGLGYCLLAFLNGKLQKGIDTILDLIEFDKELTNDTVVITGEGKLDHQSINGKVISGIRNRLLGKNIEMIVVAGLVDGDKEFFKNYGINQVIETNEERLDFEIVKKECRKQLAKSLDKISL